MNTANESTNKELFAIYDKANGHEENELKPVTMLKIFAAMRACLAIALPVESVGKYDNVLRPFFLLMEKELHANCGKGDRPGWMSMSTEVATLEIYYHVAKLAKAARGW